MTKAKKETKPKETKEPTKKELIGGRFRPDSDLAKMYTLLLDGKARTIDEIQKVVKADKPNNIGQGKYAALAAWGKESKLYTMEKKDGTIQMILADKKKSA